MHPSVLCNKDADAVILVDSQIDRLANPFVKTHTQDQFWTNQMLLMETSMFILSLFVFGLFYTVSLVQKRSAPFLGQLILYSTS